MATNVLPAFLTFLAATVVGVIAVVTQKEPPPVVRRRRVTPPKEEVQAPAKELEVEAEEEIEELVPEVSEVSKISPETPSSAFPTLSNDLSDPDAELAQAYTYGNLQDSMLNNAIDVKRTIRARPAFSRLGSRANPEAWEAQIAQVRGQIKESGQSFEQFIENSWAPIPEQLASLWTKEDESAVSEVRPQRTQRMTREAMSEAPFLTRDSIQDIPLRDAVDARARMTEILAARRRAQALQVPVPGLSGDQRQALLVWKGKEEPLVSDILSLSS